MRDFVLALVPLALTACQQEPSPAPEATPTASDSAAANPSPAASTLPSDTASDGAGIPEFGIPVALQGNWGMVAADCTSTRGDAKGLLRISGTTLTFYESVAKLGTIANRTDSAIRADFSFSGEGMTWQREEALSVAGDKLTRTERGGDEPGANGPFIYTKCAA